MTATEIDVRPQAPAIPAKIAYARALAESGLLPASYRKNPANVLWAAEYADMLGLSAMAAITGVHVIDGKPTASAGLISALVRRAGHKLRVSGTNKTATCVIVRSDDPGHPFEVTWTLKKDGDNPSAEEAGLLAKDVWKKYPASMLKSRAITQCARDACEEALFGLHYTAEELGAEVDEDGVIVEDTPAAPRPIASGSHLADELLKRAGRVRDADEADGVACATRDARAEGLLDKDQADHIHNRLRVRLQTLRVEEQLAPEPDYDTPGTATTPQIGAIWTVLTTVYKFGKDEKDQARAVCSYVTGHALESTKDMSRNEAKTVLDTLASWRETAEAREQEPREFLIELMATAENGGSDA